MTLSRDERGGEEWWCNVYYRLEMEETAAAVGAE
jgi:hypothetical protein